MSVCECAVSGNVLEFPCQKKNLGYSQDKLGTQLKPSTSSTLNQRGAVPQGLNAATEPGAKTGSGQSPRLWMVMDQGWSPTRGSGAYEARHRAGDKLSVCWREVHVLCSSGQDQAHKDELKWSPWAMGRGAGLYPLCRAIRAYWYPHGTGRLSTETLLPEAEVKNHGGLQLQVEGYLLIRFRMLLHHSLLSK